MFANTYITYLNNRHYDPTTGVFISVDPLVTMTGQPYIYGAANPVTFSDPSGLCAGSEVFDYCITDDGKVLDQGTTRLAPATNVNGASPAQVASAIDQLQVGQYDHNNPSVAGDIATGMFNRSISNGSIVPNPDGGYMLAECDGAGWCRNFWHSPISELLLGIPSTVLQQMVDVQLVVSVSLLSWPGARVIGSGSPCSSNSFVAGTLVLLADGRTVPIEDIEIGDEVWALDPESGELGRKPEIDTILGEGLKQLVSIDYGEAKIVATAAHPFWVDNRQAWVDASALEVGDVMVSLDGRSEIVEGVEQWSEEETVFNLTVAGIHTYFIVAGDDPVLVHNSSCTITGRAAELRTRAGRNRVTINTPGGRMTIDLDGKAHFEKLLQTSVNTPHVKIETKHVGPNGNVSYTSGPVRPATQNDLRLVDRVLTGRGL